jgi:hypothetical protein
LGPAMFQGGALVGVDIACPRYCRGADQAHRRILRLRSLRDCALIYLARRPFVSRHLTSRRRVKLRHCWIQRARPTAGGCRGFGR